MKISYAFRRNVFYPFKGGRPQMPAGDALDRYLAKLREIGFEGVELGLGSFGDGSEAAVKEMGSRLDSAGVPCVAISGGGGFASPRSAARSRQSWERTVQAASWIGAGVVNGRLGGGGDPKGPGASKGETISQGSSRRATADEFLRNAEGLASVADMAQPLGIRLAVEVHQHALVDNSWSALRILELTSRPNVGINPDLGNIYWTYDQPEETSEEAIVALAPHAVYWHCKNLSRTYIPQLEQAFFAFVPLPDGDIDYRFAISAMLDAGYDGYLAVEGARYGDQFTADGQGVRYVKRLLEELGAEV